MKKLSLTSIVLCFILLMAQQALGMSSANYIMTKDVLAGGGGDMTSMSYMNSSTLGQSSAIGQSTSATYSSNAGFWPEGIAQVLYKLAVTRAGTGTGAITVNPGTLAWVGPTGTASYNDGTLVALSVTPGPGSTFAGWSGDADCSDGMVTMSGNRTCMATFILNSYMILPSVSTGIGTVTCTPTSVYYNGTSTCSITPSVGYSISSVLIDGTTPVTGTSYVFTNVQANHTIQASFAAWPSWASPELGTASGITNPVIVDPNTGAWAEQVNVRTASNGAGSLVVWSERDAAGIGDIRGARLDVAGNVFDPDGFLIHSSTGDQRVPDVVWDGQSYFVVWESRDIDAGDIYGVHVSADGVVASTVIPIAVGYAQQGYPSVEFDGTQYLVAWHGYAATPLPSATGVYATAVSREGAVRTPGGFLLVDAPHGQAYPDIAFAPASQTYLVVWGDHRRTAPNPTPPPDTHEWPPFDVYGMRLRIDASGTPTFLDSLTDSLAIHVGEQCDRRPRVATDGTGFLVVDSCVNGPGTWDGTTVRMSALAHRVSANGTVSAAIEVSGGIGDAWGASVAYTDPNYFVAWVDGATAPAELLAKRVSPAGLVLDGSASVVALDPRFMLEPPPPGGRLIFTSQISLNRSRTGEALVGYTREQTPGGTTRVRARLVNVEYEPSTYMITASAGMGGSITPSGTWTVNKGGNAAFTIATNSGYQVQSVLVDGSPVGTVMSYTFYNVQADHTISVSFVAVDTAPDSFTFTAQTGAPLNTLMMSNTITVTGINTPAPISITGGQYSVNNGAFTATAGTVNNGDNIRVQLTSSGSYATTRSSTLTIGGVSGTFSVTTLAIVYGGFLSPIDNLPIVNSAKAGQAIPIKWLLTDSSGTPISDPASFRDLGSYMINCSSLTGDPTDTIEEYAAGASGLQYAGDGYWQFNWKTPKTYAGQCRTMVLTLGDGSKHEADFKFK